MLNPQRLGQQAKEELDQLVTFIITIGLVVFTDLLLGMLVGILVGIAFVLYTN